MFLPPVGELTRLLCLGVAGPDQSEASTLGSLNQAAPTPIRLHSVGQVPPRESTNSSWLYSAVVLDRRQTRSLTP